MSIRKVYFDESGHSGQDLLNAHDPVFVLASCALAEGQVAECLEPFRAVKATELKFSKLRRRPSGQRLILRFLESPIISAQNAKVFPVNKGFMIVTKYCDLVLEPSAREAGIDFSERGMNLATANLLATIMPTLLGERFWHDFLRSFVETLRTRSTSAWTEFVRRTELIHGHLEQANPDSTVFFAPVLLAARNGSSILEKLTSNDLDPLVPTFYTLIDYWGRTLGERFAVIVDSSKVIAGEAQRLLAASDSSIPSRLYGHDRRTMELPFKVASLECADSRVEAALQLADLLAGACCAVLKSRDRFRKGSFENHIARVMVEKELFIGAVWPGVEIDPKNLETDVESTPPQNRDIAEALAYILKGR